MQSLPVRDGQLEYEILGDGEPVLLVHGSHFAGSYVPLVDEPALAGYRLIRYHRRGFAGSVSHDGPFGIEAQAEDALAVLGHLGVERAHLVGHSYGGAIALQVAADAAAVVASLVLLEPALLMVPSAEVFARECVGPAVEKYASGDSVGAVDIFGQGVAGPEWRVDVSRAVPGSAEQAERDASTFFEVELPALGAWEFDDGKAARISQPLLFALGGQSGAMFEEGRDLVHSLLPQTEDLVLLEANHLLQMKDPRGVAEGIAAFLSRHPL